MAHYSEADFTTFLGLLAAHSPRRSQAIAAAQAFSPLAGSAAWVLSKVQPGARCERARAATAALRKSLGLPLSDEQERLVERFSEQVSPT